MKGFQINELKIPVPIIQGGMGVGVSLAGLASAVANNGGIGVIASVGIGVVGNQVKKSFRRDNIDALIAEIGKARKLTQGILGVNVMVALTNFDDIVRTSIEENIDIIFSGAGLPLDLPKYLTKGKKTKLVPIVSSARATKIIFEKWIHSFDYIPDAVVVEGPLAGGHLGFSYEQLDKKEFQLENLVRENLEIIKPYEKKFNRKIPLIAAGGIYTGKDIHSFLEMGVTAVQMGTRFVATHECDASYEFKKQYINATPKDIKIIKSPVGMPGRAIINPYLTKMNEGEKRPISCQYHCIKTCNFRSTEYCIANALVQAEMGNLKDGFAFSGSNAYRVDKIVSVKEVFDALFIEYKDHVSSLKKSNKSINNTHSENNNPYNIPSLKKQNSPKSLD